MTSIQTFTLSPAGSATVPKSARRASVKSGRDMMQTFAPLIICLVAIFLMPLCIPNLWEFFSGVPTIAIAGFSAGTVFILAALVCAIVQRARRREVL